MVLHDVPLAQVFALNACHAWGQGLEPSGPNYEDRDMIDALQAIVEAKRTTLSIT